MAHSAGFESTLYVGLYSLWAWYPYKAALYIKHFVSGTSIVHAVYMLPSSDGKCRSHDDRRHGTYTDNELMRAGRMTQGAAQRYELSGAHVGL